MILLSQYQTPDYVFFLANLATIAGFMAGAITFAFTHRVMPILNKFVSPFTKITGFLFFSLAAATRADWAYHAITQKSYIHLGTSPGTVPTYVNVLQVLVAIAAWIFFGSFAHDFYLRSRENK